MCVTWTLPTLYRRGNPLVDMFLIRPSLCGCLWAEGRHYYESAALTFFQELKADPENSNSILHSPARRPSLAPSTVLAWWPPFLFLLLLTPKGKGRTVPLSTHTALPTYTVQKPSNHGFFFFFFLSWSMVLGFPGGAHGKEPRLPVQETWDSASIPGNGNPVQYSCLENPMDRGAWQATVHGVTKAQTRLKWFSTQIVNFQCVRYSAKLVSGVSSRCSTKYSFSDTFPQQVITRYWI